MSLKSTATWAGIGGVIGLVAATLMSGRQSDQAVYYGDAAITVAGCVLAALTAFVAAVIKNKGR